jgi:hypothetical protein
MRKIIWILIALLSVNQLSAQPTNLKEQKSNYQKPSKDYLMLQFGLDGWSNLPDSVKQGGLSRSFNAYLCYDFPIMASNFSFAAGVGVGSSHIFLKDQQIVLNDTQIAIQFIPETESFKKYKISLTYIEAPFELRYFQNKENRNRGIKAAIGLKIGTLLNSHTKGKYTLNNKPIIEKVSTKRYVESWRFAATARVGWGNFSLFGSYHLNGLFRVNSGPENVRPYSVGICLSGL